MNNEENSSNKCPICGRSTHKESKYCIFHASAKEKTEIEFIEALKEYINEIKEENREYDFEDFIFIGDIDFKEDLSIDRFERAIFTNATFQGDADFTGAIFEGNAAFYEATFEGDANFTEATFEGDANFYKAAFKGYTDFTGANFEVLIDFKDSLLKNTKIQKSQIENHIMQDKEKNFREAKEVYLLLKNNFHSIGRYDDESWAFMKERDMERENYRKLKNFRQWILSCFLNIIYGYGERPWNVVISALVIITLFVLAFTYFGIGNPELIELHGRISLDANNDLEIISEGTLQNTTIKQFINSLYFSLITFTTLGYGDFQPLEGWGRILAGSEAFIGAFMMALFVYTFARRTGGR